MTTLRLDTLRLPTSPLGPPDPLPPLRLTADLHAVTFPDPLDQAGPDAPTGLDAEMRRNLGYGRLPSVLPYLMQSDYDRRLVETDHQVAVLENETLQATFLLGQGGRLWSLVHRPSGRELLYRPATLQLANLALRDAWFAGGVEWNLGLTGHTPLTCAPLHAARVELPEGGPMLRLYEYERMRGLVYQVDAWLPADAADLLVHITVTNPTRATVPVYWWSNTAVPEDDGVRVLAPAHSAWRFGAERVLRHVTMPVDDGIDRSYPARSAAALDYFFDLDPASRPWIAAVDGTGTGLVQTSSPRLRGRKLFLWGNGPGGRHWQRWLSPQGGRYLEIQAGLARTQLEHLPLAGGRRWSWLESYGLLEGDPDTLHHPDWSTAVAAAGSRVAAHLTEETWARYAAAGAAAVDLPPTEHLQAGSGWGALEGWRREADGEPPLALPGTPFPDRTLGAEQQPWIELLERGTVGGRPDRPPDSYLVGPAWRKRLAGADGWAAALLRGVAEAYVGDRERARSSWESSLARQPTAWAWRNLAVLSQDDRPDQVLAAYAEARRLAPDLLPLLREQLGAMWAQGDPALVLATVDELPATLSDDAQVRLLEARAAVALGLVERAGAVLEGGVVVPQLREGAQVLEELWYGYQALVLAARTGRPVDDRLQAEVRRVPLPEVYDFSMTAPATSEVAGAS